MDKAAVWGNSVWWTRTGYILGLIVIAIGVYMNGQLGNHLGSCGLPRSLTKPALAIELAYQWKDVLTITGTCESKNCMQSTGQKVCLSSGCSYVCPDKVQALLDQQFQDRFFIVAYLLLFIYLGVMNIRFGGIRSIAPKISRSLCIVSGAAAIVLAAVGACCDWVEDDRIVQALQNIGSAVMPDMRGAAYWTWRLLFIAIGCVAPLFMFWPKTGWLMRFISWATAFEAIMALVTGVTACRFGQDQRLEDASGSLMLTLPLATFLFWTAHLWSQGTLAALNKIASHQPFKFLVELQPEED